MHDEHLSQLPNITEEEELNFIKELQGKRDQDGVSLPRAISEMYLTKKLESMVDRMVVSNKAHAKAMNWLTIGLIVATLANAAVLIFK